MALIKNKNLKTALICLLIFIIWAGLSLYRTLGRNQEWFAPKEEVAVPEIEMEYLETTDEKEFFYATAWCKAGNNWVLTNIDGYAEIVLDENYTDVTNFGNTGYAVVKDTYGNKAVIDRSGNSALYDNCYRCDSIVSDDFTANMIVATKKITEDGEEKVGYGIIDATLNWSKAPDSENEYLKEFTKGIDGGVLTNEAGDKLYFYTLDTVVEDVDEFLYYDAETVMFRQGTEIYLIDKSGEHLRLDFKDVVKTGEWADKTMYCEFVDGKKQFVDINGKCVVDLTSFNVINLPRMINGYAGILMQTEEGTKYTIIDEEGKFVFEPRPGTSFDILADGLYKVSYHDNEQNRDVIGVMNEKGDLLFEVESSITNFNNGYAIKDGNTYVREDGTELAIFRWKQK